MSRIAKGVVAATVLAAAGGAYAGDVVSTWNSMALDSIRSSRTVPPMATRHLAMMHTAVYDAVNSITRNWQPYAGFVDAPQDADKRAAAACAAHLVLSNLYPHRQAEFDGQLARTLSRIPDSAQKSAGMSVGADAARRILTMRAGDGHDRVVNYEPRNEPGYWRPTEPNFAPALLPQWPQVTPWSIQSGSQFRVAPPPSITSPEYTEAFEQVRRLGGVDSVDRTPEQTEIARLWAAGGGTATPPGQWNLITQQLAESRGGSLASNARLFAMLNVALADAGITSWDAKYAYDYWRPITGIREADTDGNPDTIADPSWTPLLPTPPFPAYTSGHATFSGAAAELLKLEFGTDALQFSLTADDVNITREFSSLREAAEEASMSRIYGGIHWIFDGTEGLSSGAQVAQWVHANTMIPAPGAAGVLALGGMLAARRRR